MTMISVPLLSVVPVAPVEPPSPEERLLAIWRGMAENEALASNYRAAEKRELARYRDKHRLCVNPSREFVERALSGVVLGRGRR